MKTRSILLGLSIVVIGSLSHAMSADVVKVVADCTTTFTSEPIVDTPDLKEVNIYGSRLEIKCKDPRFNRTFARKTFDSKDAVCAAFGYGPAAWADEVNNGGPSVDMLRVESTGGGFQFTELDNYSNNWFENVRCTRQY